MVSTALVILWLMAAIVDYLLPFITLFTKRVMDTCGLEAVQDW
jgi:hypothetical protein